MPRPRAEQNGKKPTRDRDRGWEFPLRNVTQFIMQAK